MSTTNKRLMTPSLRGSSQPKISLSPNAHNISNSSNKSSVSAYFDRKHQNTKDKIEHMRTEAYNKLMSEVKPKPTISINSKKIINQLFKNRNSQNQANALDQAKSKSLNRDNADNSTSSKQKINTSNCSAYTSISQIEQYKMIIESRVKRFREMNEAKERNARSLIVKPKNKQHVVVTEVIHCQRDKMFNQEYTPYNEKAVFEIRSKLQRYYDCKTEYKAIPFNHQSGGKKPKEVTLSLKSKDNPVVVIRNNEPDEIKKISCCPPSRQTACSNAGGRRERDVQLLLEFTKGLGQRDVDQAPKEEITDCKGNINNDKPSAIKKQVIIKHNANSNQGNQLLRINKEVEKDYKQLNPKAKLFIEERMRMIKNNFQIEDPSH